MIRLGGALLLLAVPAYAAFEDIGLNARDLALGGAFTAVADDSAAAAYNPAGLASQRDGEASLGWSRRHENPSGRVDTEAGNGAAVLPFDIDEWSGTAGALVRNVDVGSVLRQREAVFSYGLRGARKPDSSRLDTGLSLRLQENSLVGGSKRGELGADAGILYRRGVNAFGLSVLNIGGPIQTVGGVSDRAVMAVKAGVAQRMPGLLVAADVTHREAAEGSPASDSVAAGLERGWALSGGTGFFRAGLSMGDRGKEASAGIGWRVYGLRVDYAALLPLNHTVVGHAVTLGYRFGGGDPVQEYEQMLTREIQNQRELAVVLTRLENEVALLKGELEKARGDLEAAQQQAVAASDKSRKTDLTPTLNALREKNAQLQDRLSRVRGELNQAGQKNLESSFHEDWAGYEKLKASGAPKQALKDALERIIELYREKNIDVSEVRQELLRLSNQ